MTLQDLRRWGITLWFFWVTPVEVWGSALWFWGNRVEFEANNCNFGVQAYGFGDNPCGFGVHSCGVPGPAPVEFWGSILWFWGSPLWFEFWGSPLAFSSPEDGDFLALDLGGTNFRVLRVKVSDNGLQKVEMESQIYEIHEDLMRGSGMQVGLPPSPLSPPKGTSTQSGAAVKTTPRCPSRCQDAL